MSDIRSASAYLVLERAKWKWDPPRIVTMRKEKPALASGQVAVKVTLRIPMEMFDEFIPEVELELAPEHVIVPDANLDDAEATE